MSKIVSPKTKATTIKVAHSAEARRVVMEFNPPVEVAAFSPTKARMLAAELVANALSVEELLTTDAIMQQGNRPEPTIVPPPRHD